MPLLPTAPMDAPPLMPQGPPAPPDGLPPVITVGGDQAAPDMPAMSPVDHLRAAIEHSQAALVGEPDDADSQQLAKVVQGLYQILAGRQKERDQTLGNPQLLRSLRRSGA